ncbi:MAG: NAD(P)H-dependent glycerol-3-phosphate dehydrogenase [Eggerthellaceae bacterium]|jgi:glycerol-3-phosphate dehydrogenase (NAD(P)+)
MKVGIIGSGSWGTALAQHLACDGYNVNMWARRPEVVESINSDHRNPRYLSSVQLSESIVATVAYEDCLYNAVGVVVATPSRLMRGVARALADVASEDMRVLICTKGIEEGSAMIATEVFEQEMGNAERLAVLSGPNHAEEVVQGVPAGTVIASASLQTARFFQQMFSDDRFRAYVSTDVTGVQVCGAAKNVVAIAVGISYGMGFGDNTAALLLTRGQAEMSRLARAMGADPLTCMGLAGTGDLVATCMSRHSRNRRLGEMLANGKTLVDFDNETHMVAEGAMACKTLLPLAERYEVDMPITEAIYSIIWEGSDARNIGMSLLSRPLKEEGYGL